MNKIIIDKEEIKLQRITKKIDVSYEVRNSIFGITKILVKVLDDCSIDIFCNTSNNKIDIILDVVENKIVNINEYTLGDKIKIQYSYNIDANSIVNINKYNNCTNIREMNIINLNGINSTYNIILKVISNTKDIYDICINHNSNNTISNINNNILCITPGRVQLQVTTNIFDNIKNCTVKYNNIILDCSKHQCEIKPNFYINNYNNEITNNSSIICNKDIDINEFLLSDLNNRKICNKIKKDIKNIGGDLYQ